MAHPRSASDVPLTSSYLVAEQVTGFLRAVYGWMCAGLAVTAATAWVVAGSPGLVNALLMNRLLFWALIIAQCGIVLTLSARVQRLAPSTASLLFIGYSALTGIAISFVLLAFTGETVARRSLQGIGQFLFMGLIGLVLASIVNIFWRNDGLQFVISFIGVIVFTGLTAYDAQRLKAMALELPPGQSGSYAVLGALTLYLDFINLFLFILRFMGRRRGVAHRRLPQQEKLLSAVQAILRDHTG